MKQCLRVSQIKDHGLSVDKTEEFTLEWLFLSWLVMLSTQFIRKTPLRLILEPHGAVLTTTFRTNEFNGTCQAAVIIIYIIKQVCCQHDHPTESISQGKLAKNFFLLYQWVSVLQYSHPLFYKACQERAATILYYSHHSAQSSTHQRTPL